MSGFGALFGAAGGAAGGGQAGGQLGGPFAAALMGGGKEKKQVEPITTPDPDFFVQKYAPGLSELIRAGNPSLSQAAAELLAERQVRDAFKGVLARSRQMAGV